MRRASKICLVTGAGSGIGRALTESLAREGALVVASDVDEGAARETARAVRGQWRALDVTDAEAFASAVTGIEEDLGPIDMLFNNAGIAVGGEARDLSADAWRRVLDVNLMGTIHGVRAVYPRMVARGRGHIVNVASIAGLSPYPLALPYTTSKHAVVGLSLGLRAEAARLGVRVSVACPGTIDTPIWRTSPVHGFDRARVLAAAPRGLSPATCAERILRGARRNDAVIVVGRDARALWMLQRLSPRAALWLHRRLVDEARSRFRAEDLDLSRPAS